MFYRPDNISPRLLKETAYIIVPLAFVPSPHGGEIKDFMDCTHEWNQANI